MTLIYWQLAGVGVRRRQWRGAAGIALIITCAACTQQSREQPAPPAPSTIPSTAASPDPKTAGADAVSAYRGMWQAYVAAMSVPDPAHPGLARYANGEALEILTKGIQETKNDGLKGTGGVIVAPEVTSAAPVNAPTEVEILDCLDSTGSQIVRASPGPPYSDSPGGKSRTTATVRWQPDGWKVVTFGIEEVGTC